MRRTLVLLIGYSGAGKSAALSWARGVFSGSFCFDVGEVARGWARRRYGKLHRWRVNSLARNRREGFGWIFRQAGRWNPGIDPRKAPLIIVSGNRIAQLETDLGKLDFIKEAENYFSVDCTRLLYLRASVAERSARQRRRRGERRSTRAQFRKRDRLDEHLGLRRLIRKADGVVNSGSGISVFEARLQAAFRRVLHG